MTSDRALFRIGSACAIGGAALVLVANVLHPDFDFSDTEGSLRVISESAAWVGVHVALLVAALLVIVGLVALQRSLASGPGAAAARLGLAMALVGGGVWGVVSAVDGRLRKVVAEAWVKPPSEEKAAALRMGEVVELATFGLEAVATVVIFGVTFALYGLAVALSGQYPRWLGWAAVAVAAGSFIAGLVELYAGPAIVAATALDAVFSLLLMIWMIVIGVHLWRRA